jgi:aspartate/methionine/tyrosine aminotransferase
MYCQISAYSNDRSISKFCSKAGGHRPGKEFGMEGHIRLSYAGSVKDITTAIERIKWALDPNSPNEIYIGDRKLIRDWL